MPRKRKLRKGRRCHKKKNSCNPMVVFASNYDDYSRVKAGKEVGLCSAFRNENQREISVHISENITHRQSTEMESLALTYPQAYDNHRIEMQMITAPVSVISETVNPRTPRYSDEELTNFGDLYDENILHLIHKHLELDTYHRVAYIGSSKGSLVSKIEKHFCLETPLTVLYPGAITYKEISDNSRRLAFKISHVGAEEYFNEASRNTQHEQRTFDRVIIINSVQYFKDIELTFRHISRCIEELGKIMVIHRPASLTTLPYFQKASRLFSSLEVPFMKIITSLQKTGCEVLWELEHVPIIMPKTKWIAMLRHRFPDELEIMSDKEVEDGIRELLNGPLNYLTVNMELEDRLLFITGTRPTPPKPYALVKRVSAGDQQLPYSGLSEMEYSLSLTKSLEKLL